MAFERIDGKPENHTERAKPGGHKCFYNSFCFFSVCNEEPDTYWREANYYEHMRLNHRDKFDLPETATNATKNEDTQKIKAIVKAHCKDRVDHPDMMEWPED